MDSQRFEVESEAWYRAIAEGRLAPVSDHDARWTSPAAEPTLPRSGVYALDTGRWTRVPTSP